MASKRISELPAATELDGSEQIPLTQAGETRRIGSGVYSETPAAADAIRYVAAGGADTNSGLSWGAAFATVQAAHDDLPTTGGLILIGGGSMTAPPNITKAGVTIRGQSRVATKLTGDIDLGGSADNFSIEDLHYEGTFSHTATGNVRGVQFIRCICRNVDPFPLNVNIVRPDVLDVVMGVHAEDCEFDQGGVFINVINTSLFERCRFANSRQDYALVTEQDSTFTGSQNDLTLLSCTVEGNKKGGVKAGRNSSGITIVDGYFESNNQDNLGYGDIDITSLETVNDGGLSLERNQHVGASSDFHVRFPSAPSRSPRMLAMLNRFLGQPTNGGALVVNPPLGLICIGNHYATTAFSGGSGPTLRLADGGTSAGNAGTETRDYIDLRDVNLYREAADRWKTDDDLIVAAAFQALGNDHWIGPTTNRVKIGSLGTANIWLDAVGSNTNIDLNLRAKGTGRVVAQSVLRALDQLIVQADIEYGLGGPRDIAGTGSPEGTVTAPVGSTYRRDDGGAGTTFWVKESGTGNTGWVAK